MAKIRTDKINGVTGKKATVTLATYRGKCDVPCVRYGDWAIRGTFSNEPDGSFAVIHCTTGRSALVGMTQDDARLLLSELIKAPHFRTANKRTKAFQEATRIYRDWVRKR